MGTIKHTVKLRKKILENSVSSIEPPKEKGLWNRTKNQVFFP